MKTILLASLLLVLNPLVHGQSSFPGPEETNKQAKAEEKNDEKAEMKRKKADQKVKKEEEKKLNSTMKKDYRVRWPFRKKVKKEGRRGVTFFDGSPDLSVSKRYCFVSVNFIFPDGDNP